MPRYLVRDTSDLFIQDFEILAALGCETLDLPDPAVYPISARWLAHTIRRVCRETFSDERMFKVTVSGGIGSLETSRWLEQAEHGNGAWYRAQKAAGLPTDFEALTGAARQEVADA
ncbi:hypothetical protein [Falsiphaeobacter marinintestinus]|uniref:hypothetical protein n=1 Tax=Falsiphaeobacter marinintestinus TaxID=1492905 RepID=UPI0011B45DF5|nr:hypothetical protein [Phaeobacter marinintestinus]